MVLTCRHANLSGNHIGTRGAQALASVIPVCQPLQTLGLSPLEIGCEGLHAVERAWRLHAARSNTWKRRRTFLILRAMRDTGRAHDRARPLSSRRRLSISQPRVSDSEPSQDEVEAAFRRDARVAMLIAGGSALALQLLLQRISSRA